jgi:hypothetical protein
MPNAREARTIVYSRVLGAMPCTVVGANRTHYLVQVYGATIHVSREEVFELQDGWALRDGRVVPSEGGEPGRAGAPALLQFEPARAPVV